MSADPPAATPEDAAGERPAARKRRVRKIDFTRPSKFTTDQQRRVERAHDAFARTLSTRLSAELRTPLSVELVDTAQLTWTNALEDVPDLALSVLVNVEPHGGQMLVCVELGLVLGLLERLLGGGADAGDDRPSNRHLSDVDPALTRGLMATTLDELTISFADLAEGLRFGLDSLETERPPSGLAPLSEPTLAVTLAARLGPATGTIMVLIPHRAIEPVLAAADAAAPSDADDAAGRVGEALGAVAVQLRAEVGSVELTVEQVLALVPGEVLRLPDAPNQGEVTLYADAVALHRARLGRGAKRRAVQVVAEAEEAS